MTQTIGQRLKAEREAQKLTLEKVFEVTRIRVPYLQALETDDFSSVPSPVQARGYLRNYAEYLGLDFQKLLDEMRAHAQDASGEVIGPADDVLPIPPSSESENNATLSSQPATQTPESLDWVRDQPEVVEEEQPLPTSKPGRRKKADSQPKPTSVESIPKRRGRKKNQQEPEPILVLDTEPPGDAQDKAEVVNVTQVESMAQPEPPVEPAVEISQEAGARDHVSDTLWQKWLNRLSSVLSARMKRRTLVSRESIRSENDPGASPAAPDVISTKDADQAPAETQNLPSQQSAEIFKEIGVQLRERRELLSLHLDEVERNTHVKAHYLEALEKGAMDELPSTVQTRGMLSNYATFLDMDVDALLLRFADALQARHRERNPQKPARKPGQPIIANVPPIRTFIAGDIIFGVGMAVLLVGFAIWGVSRVVELQSQEEVQPTAPSISDVLLASPDPSQVRETATLQPVESFPGLATVTIVIPTQDVNVEVQVNLVATERTYMRVVVDGEVAFDGRVVPGNAYPFQAESQIEVLVGSGAAIRTVYNGRDLGLMGTFGQVVSNIYTATEIITPTALPSPSPTNTVPPTSTVPPTATISSTDTPAPSNTPIP
ncbi:MAG TPA: RodZ domain-containing protein [Anaerolineales bacterium]